MTSLSVAASLLWRPPVPAREHQHEKTRAHPDSGAAPPRELALPEGSRLRGRCSARQRARITQSKGGRHRATARTLAPPTPSTRRAEEGEAALTRHFASGRSSRDRDSRCAFAPTRAARAETAGRSMSARALTTIQSRRTPSCTNTRGRFRLRQLDDRRRPSRLVIGPAAPAAPRTRRGTRRAAHRDRQATKGPRTTRAERARSLATARRLRHRESPRAGTGAAASPTQRPTGHSAHAGR